MPTSSKSTSSTHKSTSSTDQSDPITFLITHLSTTSTLEDLHMSLLSSLQRVGWTERVRALALELLRGGHCECFDEVVETVVGFASGNTRKGMIGRGRKRKRRTGGLKMENENANAGANTNINDSRNGEYIAGGGGGDVSEDADEYEEVENSSAIAGEGDDDDDSNSMFANIDVQIPKAVVGEGVMILREALDGIFVFEDEESNTSQPTSGEQQERGREPGGESNVNSKSNSSGPRPTVKAPPAETKSRSKPKGQENGEMRKGRKGKGTR